MKFFIISLLASSLLLGSIDINSASMAELVQLKGIGAKKAEAIINYREEHCFKNVSEITLVKGIGKKILQDNENDLSANGCDK